MKTTKIVLILSILTQYVFAQSHPIEIHLSLLEKNDEHGVKELALSTSIINPSDKDIYLPNFELFASYSGVHIYEKDGKVWKEINPDTHDYVKPIKPPIRQNGRYVPIDEPIFYNDENSFTNIYKKSNNVNSRYQDSLIKTYYNSSPDHHQLSIFTINDELPLFLKAKQKIDDYMVRSLDFLLKKQKEYKICFNSEAGDTLKYYRSPRVYSNKKKKFDELHYPEKIYGFNLYYPTNIISNIINFNNVPVKKSKEP
jgi:hypothetical protein